MTTSVTIPSVATPSTASPPSGHRAPGFAAAFGAEWDKLRTARSPRRNLTVGAVLGLGLAALLAVVVGVTYDDLTAAERADLDPTGPPLAGAIVPGLLLTVLGVKAVTSEYASGMIRLTLTATPRRGRVLAAKALSVAALAWAYMAALVAAMTALTLAVLAVYDVPTGGLGDGAAFRALAATVALAPVSPVIGVAVAFLTRSTATALCAVLGLAVAPSILGVLPGWWQRNVLSLTPGPATDSITVGHLEPSDLHVHPLAAALVIVAWLAAALALANASLSRRDA
jgi:ABC-2 type transport system permease protein